MATSDRAVPQDSGGHLAFYTRHGISPVRYRMADLGEHFDRRDALYRALGLAPVAFRGVRVLEVAPGSGQNSLFVAACEPSCLELVEPNPAGLTQIEAAYAGLDLPHTAPLLHRKTLEDFEAPAPFDIALCENWLGSLPGELALMRKLSTLVAPGGALVVTTVPLAGFFPNAMRKLLALRLVDPEDEFESATERLVAAFGPHLATIAGMTRSHRDWVHDCMMNPHYLHVALPVATLFETLGDGFELLGTNPRFAADWRWFKQRTGDNRDFNAEAIAAERRNLHNFVDHRRLFAERKEEDNDRLAELFEVGYRRALDWQAARLGGDTVAMAAAGQSIGATLDSVAAELSEVHAPLGEAFGELRELWERSALAPEDVAGLRHFGGVFGRETVYVSLTRRRAGT